MAVVRARGTGRRRLGSMKSWRSLGGARVVEEAAVGVAVRSSRKKRATKAFTSWRWLAVLLGEELATAARSSGGGFTERNVESTSWFLAKAWRSPRCRGRQRLPGLASRVAVVVRYSVRGRRSSASWA